MVAGCGFDNLEYVVHRWDLYYKSNMLQSLEELRKNLKDFLFYSTVANQCCGVASFLCGSGSEQKFVCGSGGSGSYPTI
jgi:hypothetical protein